MTNVVGVLVLLGAACSDGAKYGQPDSQMYRPTPTTLVVGGVSHDIQMASVRPAFYDSARVIPLLGRTFHPDDYQAAAGNVAILNGAFWRDSLGADPNIIGTRVGVAGSDWVVVGVMPFDFNIPPGVKIWTTWR